MARRQILRFHVLPPLSAWAAGDFEAKTQSFVGTPSEPLVFEAGIVHEVDVTGNPALRQAIADAAASPRPPIELVLKNGEEE